MQVTVAASNSSDAFLLERLYMLAAMTPSIMQTIPARVPPSEKAGEKNVAMATPRKATTRLRTVLRSAR